MSFDEWGQGLGDEVMAAVLHRRRWDNAAAALRYFTLHLTAAVEALLAPG